MNWTLIGVIAIFLFCLILGYRKGLIKMLFSTVSIVVILIITSFAAPKLATYLREHTTLDDKLSVKVEAYYDKKGVTKQNDGTFSAEDLPLPGLIRDKIEKNVNDGIDTAYDKCNDVVVAATTTILFSILVYIVMMLLLYIIFWIVCGVLNVFSKLPVLKQINEIVGLLIGLLQGLIIVWILFIIITASSNLSFVDYIFKDIDRNAFLTFLYDKNILMNIIIGFFS